MCLCPALGTSALRRHLALAPDRSWSSTVAAGEQDPVASFIKAARSVGRFVAVGRRYREVLSRVDAPVVVAHGAVDRVVAPDRLRQLHELQLGWPVHVLPGVGHSPHVETPVTVARLLQAGAGTTGGHRGRTSRGHPLDCAGWRVPG